MGAANVSDGLRKEREASCLLPKTPLVRLPLRFVCEDSFAACGTAEELQMLLPMLPLQRHDAAQCMDIQQRHHRLQLAPPGGAASPQRLDQQQDAVPSVNVLLSTGVPTMRIAAAAFEHTRSVSLFRWSGGHELQNQQELQPPSQQSTPSNPLQEIPAESVNSAGCKSAPAASVSLPIEPDAAACAVQRSAVFPSAVSAEAAPHAAAVAWRQLQQLHHELTHVLQPGVVLILLIGRWETVRRRVGLEGAEVLKEGMKSQQLQFTAAEFSKQLLDDILADKNVHANIEICILVQAARHAEAEPAAACAAAALSASFFVIVVAFALLVACLQQQAGRWLLTFLEDNRESLAVALGGLLQTEALHKSLYALAMQLLDYLSTNPAAQKSISDLLVYAIYLPAAKDSAGWWVAEILSRPDVAAAARSFVVNEIFNSSWVYDAFCLALARSAWDVLQMEATSTLSKDLVMQVLKDPELQDYAKQLLWQVFKSVLQLRCLNTPQQQRASAREETPEASHQTRLQQLLMLDDLLLQYATNSGLANGEAALLQQLRVRLKGRITAAQEEEPKSKLQEAIEQEAALPIDPKKESQAGEEQQQQETMQQETMQQETMQQADVQELHQEGELAAERKARGVGDALRCLWMALQAFAMGEKALFLLRKDAVLCGWRMHAKAVEPPAGEASAASGESQDGSDSARNTTLPSEMLRLEVSSDPSPAASGVTDGTQLRE
ncbi:hypothetical protein cyc_04645 [Cyclospora cayetanensis]|uniref:Uncharacterized protein n=1 Tax=Cyclospora cayetanensis TaxID=88456 RepID=A0A1D3CYT0_9EIME|nr:hypothetical protein cyc_04645 [Cyclospora cayetanensis]